MWKQWPSVLPEDRMLSLDVLRGFAIFGVLLAYVTWNLGSAPPEAFNSIDAYLGSFLEFAVDGKFYTILSFLFGYGFFLQMKRAEDRGANVVRTYCRRLLVLMCFGLLHAVLLRNGDVLLPYAVTGFLLLPFRHASNRVILVTAILMIFYVPIANAVWEMTGVPMPKRPQTKGLSYPESNLIWVRYWYSLGVLYWIANLSVFLIGFYSARNRLLQKLASRRKLLITIMVVGLALGIGLFLSGRAYSEAVGGDPTFLQKLLAGRLYGAHVWSIAASYIALILLLLRSEGSQSGLKPLAAVGRMALTNYIMQAILILPICVAFDLFDRFTPSLSLSITLAVFFLVQMPFSVLWLKRFDIGPLEWLWRRLSYGRARSQAQASVAG